MSTESNAAENLALVPALAIDVLVQSLRLSRGSINIMFC